MGHEIAAAGRLVPTDMQEKIKEIEAVVAESGLSAVNNMDHFQKMFALARGMERLRSLITNEMLADIMKLQGSPLGFKTDRDAEGKKYDEPVVREVVVEALLRGFRMVNNETNIIAGNFYGAKNGFWRKVREFPGLTELELMLGVPKRTAEDMAVIAIGATWKLNNVPQKYPREKDSLDLAIRVNRGMGPDALYGKATRKLLARIWDQLTGQTTPEGEPDDDGSIEVKPTRTSTGDSGQTRSSAVHDRVRGQQDAPKTMKGSPDAATDSQLILLGQIMDEMEKLQPGLSKGALKKSAETDDLDELSYVQAEEATIYLQALLEKLQKSAKKPADKPSERTPQRGSGSDQEQLLP